MHAFEIDIAETVIAVNMGGRPMALPAKRICRTLGDGCGNPEPAGQISGVAGSPFNVAIAKDSGDPN